jgi:hypothetical protein
VKLLIVDELGYVPLSHVTSNPPFEEWPSVFRSERLTGALLDRLTHHVHILEMNGESYRLKQSAGRRRAAGRSKTRPPPAPSPKRRPAMATTIPALPTRSPNPASSAAPQRPLARLYGAFAVKSDLGLSPCSTGRRPSPRPDLPSGQTPRAVVVKGGRRPSRSDLPLTTTSTAPSCFGRTRSIRKTNPRRARHQARYTRHKLVCG